jgi:branched-chain amino acid transport system substrate-binding protein
MISRMRFLLLASKKHAACRRESKSGSKSPVFWSSSRATKSTGSARPRSFFAAVGVLTAAALVLASCSSSTKTTPKAVSKKPVSTKAPILIGDIEPLTGAYQGLGKSDVEGAKTAVALINAAGGIDGRKIKLIVENDQTTPSQAVVDLKSLVGQGVVAVIGSDNSGDSLAAEPIAERDGVPYVSTSASVRQVTPVHKYVFMTPPTTANAAKALLEYFKYKGWTRLAIAYESDNAFSISGYQQMEKLAPSYGIDLVSTQTFTSSTTAFSSLLFKVAAAKPDVLMCWGIAGPPIFLTKDWAAAHEPFHLAMSHGQAAALVYGTPVGTAGNGVIVAAAAGVVGPQLPASSLKNVVLKAANAFEARYHSYPNQFSFDSIDAVDLIAAAIKAGGATRSGIESGLEHLSLLTPEGTYHYTSTDHSGLHAKDMAVTRLENGNFELTKWSKGEFQKYFG